MSSKARLLANAARNIRSNVSYVADGVTDVFDVPSTYNVGYIDVFFNGVKLTSGVDYTATDGSTVVFNVAPLQNTRIEIDTFGVSLQDASYIGTTLTANGDVGTTGQVLMSGGSSSNAYWSTASIGNGNDSGSVAVVDVVNSTSSTDAASANAVHVAYAAAVAANTRAASAQTAATSAYSNAVSYADTTFAPKANPTITGTATISAISANGSLGTAGQVLTSNGTSTHWSTVSGGGFTNGQSISVNTFVATGTLNVSGNGAIGNVQVADYLGRSTLTFNANGFQRTTLFHNAGGNRTLSICNNPGGSSIGTHFYQSGDRLAVGNYEYYEIADKFQVGNNTANAVSFAVSDSGVTTTGPLVVRGSLTANSSTGTAGQVLTSNGTGTYWSTVSGGGSGSINTAAQYSWTNTHTFAGGLQVTAPSSTFVIHSNYVAMYNWEAYISYGNEGANLESYVTTNQPAVIDELSIFNDTVTIHNVPISYPQPNNGALYLNVNSSTNLTWYLNGVAQSANTLANICSQMDPGYSTTDVPSLTFRTTGFAVNGDVVTVKYVLANNSTGTAGQVLTSSGTGTYWSTVSGGGSVDVDAQYTWTNTHTFSNTITIHAIAANGDVGTAGQVLTSNGTSAYWSTAVTNTYVTTTYAPKASPTFTGTVALPRVSANGSSGTAGQVLTSNGTGTYWSTVSTGGGGGGGADLSAVSQDITPATGDTFNIGAAGNAFNHLHIGGDLHAGNSAIFKHRTANIGTIVDIATAPGTVQTVTINNAMAMDYGLYAMYFAYPWDQGWAGHAFKFMSNQQAATFYNDVFGQATSLSNVTFIFDNYGTQLDPWTINISMVTLIGTDIYFSCYEYTDVVSGNGWLPEWWRDYFFAWYGGSQQTISFEFDALSGDQYILTLDGPAAVISDSDAVILDNVAISATQFARATISGNTYIKTGSSWNMPDANAGQTPASAAIYYNFDALANSAFVPTGSHTLTQSNTIIAGGGTGITTGLNDTGNSMEVFDGGPTVTSNTSYVTWSDTSGNLNVGLGAFTVEAWIKSNTVVGSDYDTRRVFSTAVNTYDDNFGFGASKNGTNGVIRVWATQWDSFDCNTNVINDGLWHHIAVVNDGTDWFVYIDGVLDKTQTGWGTTYNVDFSNAMIGGAAANPTAPWYSFNGLIDDFTLTLSAKYTSNFTPFNNLTDIVVGGTLSVASATSEIVFTNVAETNQRKLTYNSAQNSIRLDGLSADRAALTDTTILNSTISNTVVGNTTVKVNGYFDQIYPNGIYGCGYIDVQSGYGNFGRLQVYGNTQVSNATYTYAAISAYNGGIFANGHMYSNSNIYASKHLYVGNTLLTTTAAAYQISGFTTPVFYANNSSWRLPTNTALDFGTGDFTIEFWMKGGMSQPAYAMVMDGAGNNAGTGLGVGANDGGSLNGKLRFRPATGSSGIIESSAIVLDDQWHHIACVRQGANGYIFVDGVMSASTTAWVSKVGTLSGGSVTGSSYGGGTSTDNYFRGYLTNLRIVKGTAVYTSNFTVPAAKLTAISGTSLLIMQDSPSVDNSPNAFTLAKLRPVDFVVTDVTLGSASAGVTTSGTFVDGKGAVRATPIVAKANTYTLTAMDTGTVVSTSNNVTVPPDLPTGTSVKIYNSSSSNITVAAGSGTTLYTAGTATAGDKTLAQHSIITATYVGSNTVIVDGNGIS